MIVQLNPPLLFNDAQGRHVTAYMAMDYSQEHDTLFLCGYHDSKELWWVPQSGLRMQHNISLRRPHELINDGRGEAGRVPPL